MKMVQGAQLYTIRDYCQNEKDFGISMKRVADIGYKTVQISGIGNIPAGTIRDICDKNGLKIVLTHIPPDRVLYDTEKVIAEHEIMGCKYIGIGSMPEKYRAADWIDRFAGDYLVPARKIAASGKLFMYHNHDFEFQRFNGKYIIEYLTDAFTAEELGFTFDTYWVQVAGCDVADWIERLSGRLPCVHLKDLEMISGKPYMAPVLEGNLNFPKFLKAFEKAGTEYLLVEQDTCLESPFACLKKSYDNLKALGYK